LSQKTLFLGQKVWKNLETGFSECLEIAQFQNFQKLQKTDVKLELRKLRKTRYDSKTDSKVGVKSLECRSLDSIMRDSMKRQKLYEALIENVIVSIRYKQTPKLNSENRKANRF